MPPMMLALVMLSLARIADGDDSRATWDVKSGFIPGTKPDVEGTGFITVEEAKLRCEQRSDCLAFTFRDAPDVKGCACVARKDCVVV